MNSIPLNPRAEEIGRANVIFAGTARRHHVPPMRGSVSIKGVVRGAAMWEAAGRQFMVREGSWLLLPDGEEYSLHVDAPQPVTTFCLFFRSGFVENAIAASVHETARLLDDPEKQVTAEPCCGLRVESEALRRLLAEMRTEGATEEHFVRAALLIGAEHAASWRAPSVKTSTRAELARRVQRGTDFLLSHLDEKVTVEEAARAACLSLFHFHRMFAAIHGLSPYQFLLRRRLALAARLLERAELDVTSVARSVGFDTPASFSTRFAREFGETPSAYRLARLRRR